jgi:hypothetical protein
MTAYWYKNKGMVHYISMHVSDMDCFEDCVLRSDDWKKVRDACVHLSSQAKAGEISSRNARRNSPLEIPSNHTRLTSYIVIRVSHNFDKFGGRGQHFRGGYRSSKSDQGCTHRLRTWDLSSKAAP